MIRKLFRSQLRINMLSGVAIMVVNTLILTVAYPVYLHFLGYEKYGVWLVLAIVLSFAQLGDLGIRQAVIKLVAEEHGRSNTQGVCEYATTGAVILIVSGLFIVATVILFKHQIAHAFELDQQNTEMVVWLLPYMACLSVYVLLVQSCNAMLSGLGRMDLANSIRVVGRISALLVAVFCLYKGRGVASLLIGNTVSYLVIHIISLAFLRRMIGGSWFHFRHLRWERCKRLFGFGGSVFGASAVRMLVDPFNKLMLTRYAGVTTVPIYEIAFRATAQIKGLFVSALSPLMPEVSQLSGQLAEAARTRVIRINRKARRLTMACMGPLVVGLLFGAPWLLALWLQARYNPAIVPAFRLALFVHFVSLLGVPAYYTLLGIGRSKCAIMGALIIAVGNVVVVSIMVLFVGYLSVNAVLLSLIVFVAMTSLFYMLKARQITRKVHWEAAVRPPRITARGASLHTAGAI
jgi:O-antigen/teichoic acid export membrane protein